MRGQDAYFLKKPIPDKPAKAYERLGPLRKLVLECTAPLKCRLGKHLRGSSNETRQRELGKQLEVDWHPIPYLSTKTEIGAKIEQKN